MVKLDPIQSMMKLAETIADIIVIPDHCTLDRDDIYQEVCLIYLERGYTKTPGILKDRIIKSINSYVNRYGCEIPCGLLEEAIEYNIEMTDIAAAISAVAATTVETSLKMLTPREEQTIRMHFGINQDEHNLDEVGDELGITGNRVSQIEHKGIRKLRHPSRYKYLEDIIEMLNTGNYFM